MASISGLSGEVTGMADQLLRTGRTLTDGASDAHWTGAAADQFRAHADIRASDIRNCVDLLDAASRSVQALASEVES